MNIKRLLASSLAIIGILALSAAWAPPRPAGPDLNVQVLAAYGGETVFTEGNTFSFPDYPQLIVKNVGNAAATGHWITTYQCKAVPNSGPGGTTPQLPTVAEEKFGTTSSPTLAPGQPWTLWVTPNFKPLPAGKFILSGLVELADDANKSNNYAEITITVNPKVTPITINAVLVAPTIDKVEAATALVPTKINLTFREHSIVRRAKGVIIERKSTSSGYQQIAKTVNPASPVKIDKGDGITMTYQDGPLGLGTYTYRMKAYDDKGESGFSNEMPVTVKAPVKLPTEKIIR